jgi:hypothetical protein
MDFLTTVPIRNGRRCKLRIADLFEPASRGNRARSLGRCLSGTRYATVSGDGNSCYFRNAPTSLPAGCRLGRNFGRAGRRSPAGPMRFALSPVPLGGGEAMFEGLDLPPSATTWWDPPPQTSRRTSCSGARRANKRPLRRVRRRIAAGHQTTQLVDYARLYRARHGELGVTRHIQASKRHHKIIQRV